MSLRAYVRKRDFTRTAEPRGAKRTTTARKARRLTLRLTVTITPPCGRSAGWRIACNLPEIP